MKNLVTQKKKTLENYLMVHQVPKMYIQEDFLA